MAEHVRPAPLMPTQAMDGEHPAPIQGLPEIPGYRLDREIGRGGMATVYLAEQESLGRPVAVKVIRSRADDAEFASRFLREGRTVAQLRHRHIVPVYDIGRAGEHLFIAMEYVDGGNLRTRIARGMTHKAALDVIRQMAEALGHAHAKHFVHRDVKPENILFREDGSAVLSDFGIAKAVAATTQLTDTGVSLGTPSYMSPEQARSQSTDGRADLYALGIILYEMLIGRPPFTGDDPIAILYAHVHETVPRLPMRLSRVQPILKRLLAKKPDARYGDAHAVLVALKGLRKGRVPKVARWAGFTRPPWADRRTAFAAAGLATILAAVLWFAAGAPDPEVAGTAEPGPAVVAGGDPDPVAFDPGQQVAVLLRQARAYMAVGRLVDPPADNAWQRYRAVLNLEADNSDARRGLERIAAVYLDRARDEQAAGRPGAALEAASWGLVVDPSHPELRALRDTVRQQFRTAPQTTPTEALLAQAQAHLAADRLTRPADDNALAAFEAVLARDPDNAAAREGIGRIADRYARLAEGNRARGKLEQAAQQVETGLKLAPGHTVLKGLRQEIRAGLKIAASKRPRSARKAYALAERSYRGDGRARNRARAAALYRQAADLGSTDALFALGVMYARGQGVTVDLAAAVDYLRRAAKKGHGAAAYYLGLAYLQGKGVARSRPRAFAWVSAAAEQGYRQAYPKLGWMYEHGYGVAKSWSKSLRWYARGGRADVGYGLSRVRAALGGPDAEAGVKTIPGWEFEARSPNADADAAE